MARCRTCDKEITGPATTCNKCAESLHPLEVDADGIPSGVKGWSWGAFLLNGIWSIGNRTWIGLLAFIPVIGLVMAVALGIKGREWAWKRGQWHNLDHFNEVQRRWSAWAIATAGSVITIALVAAVAVPAWQHHQDRQRFTAVVDTLALGKPVLAQYLNDGGGDPMEEQVLTYVHSLGEGNPAITGTDAFASGSYADILASVSLGDEHGAVYLVSDDGGTSWRCRTTLPSMASSTGCEVAALPDRPHDHVAARCTDTAAPTPPLAGDPTPPTPQPNGATPPTFKGKVQVASIGCGASPYGPVTN